jgi:hypothetical protein
MSLMPCFMPEQAFSEGVVIGRLLAGYGELELTMCDCLIKARQGDFDGPVREIFGQRGAEGRIRTAKKLLVPHYTKANLHPLLISALNNLEWCRQIRNQYAHCQWYWTKDEGLCFVNLEALAKHPTKIDKITANRQPIGLLLLKKQEEFFAYVKWDFTHLASAYQGWIAKQSAPRRPIHIFAAPSPVARPPLHN